MANAVDIQQMEPGAGTPQASLRKEKIFVICCYAMLFLAIAFFAGVRFHLRHTPLERDGGEYAYMGQLMLEGVPPYKLAANMKLPGTYAAYAVIMAVFGQTPAGIHMGVMVVTSLSAIFLFLIGKRLYGPLAGAVAGASLIFFSARPGVLGIDGQATHFVNVMALAGIWLLLCALPLHPESPDAEDHHHRLRTSLLFAAGLCFGLSFLMKQPGILFGVFAAIFWFYRERNLARKMLVGRGAALVLGTLIPYAATCLVMVKAGVFHNFWFWTWTYARQYATLNDLHWGWINLKIHMPWVVRPFPLWAFAALGVLAPLWCRHVRPHAGFLTGFAVASFVAVCPGLYFRPHYWIVWLPAGALAIGVALESIHLDLLQSKFHKWAAVPLIIFLLVYVTAVHGQWKAFYRLDPDDLSRKMYGPGQDFPNDVKIAEFIQSRAHPGDQIGIFGSEPEICFYTHLRCATSYIYLYPLMERQIFAKQMQEDMKRQLEAATPRFFVYVDDSWSSNFLPTLELNRPFMDWGWDFAHRGYRQIYAIRVQDLGEYTRNLYGDRATFYLFERVTD